MFLKSTYAGRSFAWTSLHKSISWTAPVAEGGLQEVHFQTL